MGISQQPNLWQCGPFSLKHGLLVHGILAAESDISRIAGTTRFGTDEEKLARAAARYGCDLETTRRIDPEKARRELVEYLRDGIPCLLCVEEWNHWVTVVREERGRFILLDSQEPKVIVIATWPKLRNMWVYHEQDEVDEETVHTYYDLHPLVPRQRVAARANFSLERARYLRRKENREFARRWNEYVDDVLAICRPRRPGQDSGISLGEFLRRHEAMILEELDYWHGDLEPRHARRILDRLHLVADTYGLVISLDREKRTIAAVSTLLALWAAAWKGVSSFYPL